MAPRPDDGRVARLTERREPDSVKIARIEEAVNGIREDVAEIKAAQKATFEAFDHRVSYLEDVRVTGLENREIARKAVAEERARASDAARAAAEQAAAHVTAERKLRISRRDIWGTAILLAVGGIVAALIAAHILF